MALPSAPKWHIALPLEDKGVVEIDLIDTGVPHAILFTKDIDAFPLNDIAPLIRHHERLKPAGANVTVVQCLHEQQIAIRTFERGVEAETLACGSGATAAAISANKRGYCKAPITVRFASQEEVEISFSDMLSYKDLMMSGPAHHIYDGSLSLRNLSHFAKFYS